MPPVKVRQRKEKQQVQLDLLFFFREMEVKIEKWHVYSITALRAASSLSIKSIYRFYLSMRQHTKINLHSNFGNLGNALRDEKLCP